MARPDDKDGRCAPRGQRGGGKDSDIQIDSRDLRGTRTCRDVAGESGQFLAMRDWPGRNMSKDRQFNGPLWLPRNCRLHGGNQDAVAL
jgi:hypothetical protein